MKRKDNLVVQEFPGKGEKGRYWIFEQLEEKERAKFETLKNKRQRGERGI